MSRFKGRSKRWAKKIKKARWLSYKREMLATGNWIEVEENTLAPKGVASDYPPYVPTHLGGARKKGKNVNAYTNIYGLPPRGVMRRMKTQAKLLGLTVRQFITGNW